MTMRVSPLAAVAVALVLALALDTWAWRAEAHNITKLLAQHPSLSSFNHYLTLTHLAEEINRRQTITVCALDNAAMAAVTSKGHSLYTLRNILSLHVLVDYYATKHLHKLSNRTTLTATMFQATGMAPGNSGYVNITDLHGGKVGFSTADNSGTFSSFFVKSVVEKPYNISVVEISAALSSPEADAPTPAPSALNLAAVLAFKGCRAFSALLTATNVTATFHESVDSGLTMFCASDAVVNAFMPKYKKLTKAGQRSLMLYHAVPVYNSLRMLQTTNAVMSTLASVKSGKYEFTVQTDGNVVTLDTEVVSRKITGTLLDEEPLSIYKVDKMLLPKELFKVEKAQSPESSDDGDVSDQTGGSVRIVNGLRWVAVVWGVMGGIIFL